MSWRGVLRLAAACLAGSALPLCSATESLQRELLGQTAHAAETLAAGHESALARMEHECALHADRSEVFLHALAPGETAPAVPAARAAALEQSAAFLELAVQLKELQAQTGAPDARSTARFDTVAIYVNASARSDAAFILVDADYAGMDADGDGTSYGRDDIPPIAPCTAVRPADRAIRKALFGEAAASDIQRDEYGSYLLTAAPIALRSGESYAALVRTHDAGGFRDPWRELTEPLRAWAARERAADAPDPTREYLQHDL